MFTPRISLPPLCRGLGGLEGSSQRSLQRNGTIRKTLSGGMSAMRRHSQCLAVKLQTVSLSLPATLASMKALFTDLPPLLFHHKGRPGEPDPSSQARLPAVPPRKGRRWKLRCSGTASAAAGHADPVGPAVPPDRSARLSSPGAGGSDQRRRSGSSADAAPEAALDLAAYSIINM